MVSGKLEWYYGKEEVAVTEDVERMVFPLGAGNNKAVNKISSIRWGILKQ